MTENSEFIKNLRKQSETTILELAKKMGVSPEYVTKIELGEIEPTEEQIEVIKQFIRREL